MIAGIHRAVKMDAMEVITRLEPPPTSDAISQIVRVFHDGCRDAEVLRRSSERLSASEIEVAINAIEVRMLREISSICGEFLMETPLIPRN